MNEPNLYERIITLEVNTQSPSHHYRVRSGLATHDRIKDQRIQDIAHVKHKQNDNRMQAHTIREQERIVKR